MTDPGLWDQSYPPSMLAGAPLGASRMRARTTSAAAGNPDIPDSAGGQLASLQLTAGPGGYTTPVKAPDRPRNLAELTERVQLTDLAPWPAGAGLPMGARGKVAHWTGTSWKGGESPGYPGGPAEEGPGDTQFPGDGEDAAEDLTR